MYQIGIMQGRLSPRRNGLIQSFPFGAWQKEFIIAGQLGFAEIEWIFDFENYKKNPLWTPAGIKKIKEIVQITKVQINFICADFFMAKPFFRCRQKEYIQRKNLLKKLIQRAPEIKAKGIEIPLVDNSSLKTPKEIQTIIQLLKSLLPEAEKYHLELGLETDRPPKKLLYLLQKINHPLIKANYDTGNSAALGYNPQAELLTYGHYINNIHIKDRLRHGPSVPLGNGSTNFDLFFKTLKKIKYPGNFILQTARQKDDLKAAASYKYFVEKYIKKYLL